MKKVILLIAAVLAVTPYAPAFAQWYPGQPVIIVQQPVPMPQAPCVPIPAAGVVCR